VTALRRGQSRRRSASNPHSLLERDKDSILSGWRRWSGLLIAEGRGSTLIDSRRKVYVDLTSAGAVCNVGHNHPSVVKAITAQAQALIHVGYHSAANQPALSLAEKLKSIAPFDFHSGKVAFTNSGSESVDLALKIAKVCTRRSVILAYEGSHHGSTIASAWASGDPVLWKGLTPRGLDVVHVPYPYCYRCPLGLNSDDCGLACAEYFEHILGKEVLAEDVGCLLLEPVQQAAGIIVPPTGYFEVIGKLCKDNGIMIVADEVVTALGRTGRMFGIDHYDLDVDMITLGKPLASGLPLGAVIGKKALMNTATKSVHVIGSCAGNPVCCAASFETIRIIEKQRLVKRAASLGKVTVARLKELAGRFQRIGEVRGLGLLIGVEFVKDRKTKRPAPEIAKRVVDAVRKRGVLTEALGTYKNVLRISPPLNIEDDKMESSLVILEEAVARIA
jgi:4-aminobutyrate aminotransferase/(S)-3-amino-2-methylpropionate transaminase